MNQDLEAYFYKDMTCCLHPCSVVDCPEPICAMEFPGGIRAYQRYRELVCLINQGMNVNEIAILLDVPVWRVKYLKKKISILATQGVI